MNAIDQLVQDLGHPGMPVELAVLLGCLGLAGLVCWAIGRKRASDSVWFGRAVVDGLLFPLLALALTYAARRVVETQQTVVLLRLAVPVLVSLAGIRFIARVLTVAFPTSGLARLMERMVSWIAWIGTVLWVIGVLPAVRAELDAVQFAFGKSRVSVLNMIDGVLSAGVVLIAALWISAVLERQVLRQAVHDLSLRKVAANAVRATLLLVGLLFALSTAGVDITALSVLGGALGVGLGFGLQKLASNYVSGFVILFERSLRIGDVVRVDGFEGEVVDIKTRYTLIRAMNGRESIVPNEKLITERIENLSLADTKVLLTTDVAVAYDSDVDRVQAILVEAAAAQERVLADPGPSARLVKFGADGLEFSLFFWIADPLNGQLNVRSAVNLAVLKGLREAGIDIPYPQRVVHVRQTLDAEPPRG
ncbi:MAG TPA: mechanosensitive ion channel domain-containing protein [Ramlibacter sp.]|jgi:small-conductance mechanosensitive channel|uniref:mechanosensitive ion channel domain-containing protein n=1 Tax=Ramlibacter sp. TaxID=1917967 RepID=UPI002D6BB568|nr:mechanosensitive ion channel domain-containing protein [Ramlibacter sp.]HZY20656.1 mechanosensitive ion channel domain-containing protein [Ramlibacter sp.]